ncbi:MAG: prepilin-type N-terminal cleavage/methylation domain-containing protein [Tepidisphaeraceae bacterium]|jgi:general secretion pathway protein G
MSAFRPTARKGFTLVEILIVVIILGILAAIVIPQFTNASSDARNSSLASTLQTLRSQIELYKLQHGDTLPNLVASWAPFTGTTTYGNPATTFGPYMQATPTNPENGFSTVIDSTSSPGASVATGTGFVYDYNGGNGTGEIYGTADTAGVTVAPY